MKIDYHVHLEEGPYSPNWIARTAKALEYFQKEKDHSLSSAKQLLKQLNSRVEDGCYSDGWLDLYLQRAKQLGLKEVGIVDHLYRFQDTMDYYKKHIHLEGDKFGDMQQKWLNQVAVIPSIEQFIESIQSQKEKWEKHGVTLKLGIEADFFPNGEEELERLIENKPWDYVIGSVHFVDGWGFDNPEAAYLFEEGNLLDLYKTHTSYVCQAIESGLFDILAHLDNLKVFSYRPDEGVLKDSYEMVASMLKKHDTASEVNTGLSYRYPIKEACPSSTYLQTLANYEIPMTLSSDSHYPDDLGTNLDQAANMLKKYSYENIVGFTKRKRYTIPME
ncbi:histidinol phosphate phosphatase domain-containing protein [Oceanobacillus salinisoli]|uniref:histidinol phosphate phosphatase domain-containing protein n=1 Tax=Oceanobacillus salinisoli TaxID=2678611 RepID=UPI0012E0E022|nr:histidinol phosphate phosphatase domain-containing protein [Oceanobacillus salinisoli]